MVPKPVAERGEEQRRGLTRHARQRQEDSRDDAFEGGADDDLHDHPPVGDAEGQRRFAIAVGHQQQHFLGGPHDEGDHDQAEHDAARPGGKRFHRHHHQRVNDNPPDDGRHAVEDVGREANPPIESRRAEFGQKDSAQHADRHADQGRQAEQYEGADDRVGHAAPRFPDGFGQVREKVQVHRSNA